MRDLGCQYDLRQLPVALELDICTTHAHAHAFSSVHTGDTLMQGGLFWNYDICHDALLGGWSMS